MKRIIIADDEPHLRLLVRTTLETESCEVLEASDGPEALALARATQPDLLILDWQMPSQTGLEVLRVLRDFPETAGLPVIMLTGKTDKSDRRSAILLGIRGYLAKPFSPIELIELVDKVLEGQRVVA